MIFIRVFVKLNDSLIWEYAFNFILILVIFFIFLNYLQQTKQLLLRF